MLGCQRARCVIGSSPAVDLISQGQARRRFLGRRPAGSRSTLRRPLRHVHVHDARGVLGTRPSLGDRAKSGWRILPAPRLGGSRTHGRANCFAGVMLGCQRARCVIGSSPAVDLISQGQARRRFLGCCPAGSQVSLRRLLRRGHVHDARGVLGTRPTFGDEAKSGWRIFLAPRFGGSRGRGGADCFAGVVLGCQRARCIVGGSPAVDLIGRRQTRRRFLGRRPTNRFPGSGGCRLRRVRVHDARGVLVARPSRISSAEGGMDVFVSPCAAPTAHVGGVGCCAGGLFWGEHPGSVVSGRPARGLAGHGQTRWRFLLRGPSCVGRQEPGCVVRVRPAVGGSVKRRRGVLVSPAVLRAAGRDREFLRGGGQFVTSLMITGGGRAACSPWGRSSAFRR